VLFTRLIDTTRDLLSNRGSPGRPIRIPSLCAVCRGWGSQRVCAACVECFSQAVPRCLRCALRLPAGATVCGACLIDPPPYSQTLASVDYDHPWDGLVTHFKFHAALDLVPALATRMLATLVCSGNATPQLLLPIPLSTARLRERGYNQSWELAKWLARRLPCPADPALLLRVRETPHQLALPPERRAANVQAAFAVEPLRRAELRGRSVTLVDDVMTTGATVAEAARTLLQAGAAEVSVWVVARTQRHDDL
jgi:ComF family protein